MDKSQYLKAREYEMMAVLLPDQGDEETTAAIDAVLGYITEQNGTIGSSNADSPWGRRRLAYTVRHEGVDYRDGHYVLVRFNALPSAINDIERELKLDTNVIRYLILIHDPEMGEKIDESAIAAANAEAAEAAAEAAAVEDAPAETEATAVEDASAETEEAAVEDAPAEAEEAAAEDAPAAEVEEAAEAEAEESEEA